MKQISILGCGWLGFPLAKELRQKGHRILGATTSPEKLPELQVAGIEPYLIRVSGEGIMGDIDSFLDASEILIVNFPPKRTTESDSYVSKAEQLLAAVKRSRVRKVLWISSTSVFPDQNQTITDDLIPSPETESGRQLYAAEQLFVKDFSFQTTVLRFGGLIGQDRHPVFHLAGRTDIANAQAPVNLIHLRDCIGIISAMIDRDRWGETFNAAAPLHPSRVSYYTQKAIEFDIEAPQFNLGQPSVGKIILSDKIDSVLGYTFAPNPL